MTHTDLVFSRLQRSRRVVLGLVLLGMLALFGTFAELIASPAPLLAVGPRGVLVLPILTRPFEYEGRTEREVAKMHEEDRVVWPLVRSGPTTPTDAGPSSTPTRQHPLGTDTKGRDLLARLVYGARNALGLSLFAVLLSSLLGVALGGLAGYRGGFWNDRLARLVETVDTFPAIIVVALVRAIEQRPSALSLVLTVAFVRWAEVARLVRAETIKAAAEDWVTAARALGARPIRVFWRHILPNVIGPVFVSAAFGVAAIVLLEAAISFLEMGAQSDAASWGETLAQGARHPNQLKLILLPGFLLTCTVGGSYLLADALRDATDPKFVRSDSPLDDD